MVVQAFKPDSKVIETAPPIALKGISWQTYQAILAEVGDDRPWRIAYDRGVLELRMPLSKHEEPKRLIESFVEAIADELEIEIRSLGALTLEREDLTRAIEPDTCFYIQNEFQVRGKDDLKFPDDPPPDLVVESDYTSSSLNKFSLYAALGVPELWRYHLSVLQAYHLIDGEYQPRENSLVFPFLAIAEISGFIECSKTTGQRSAVREFRSKIREILKPEKE